MMWTTVFRPPGAGPFPLAVINHGSTQNELQRAGYRQPEYPALTEWLVAHGYAVAVPQRPGHGKTGGNYFEDQGGCANADFRKAGLNTAASIAAAIDYHDAISRSSAKTARSPSASRPAAGARWRWPARTIRRSRRSSPSRPGGAGESTAKPASNCAPERLIAAARAVRGEDARSRRSGFMPRTTAISRRTVEAAGRAYRLAGGRAEYHLLPPVGEDGHDLIQARGGVPLWAPLLEKFLKS